MNKYQKRDDSKLFKREAEIYLGESDKIVYVNKYKKNRKLVEITTVAYVSLIKGEWITLVYYDNNPSHGVRLHVHITKSFEDRDNSGSTIAGVRQRGSVHRLNTWAVQNLLNNWHHYKRAFLKRSNLKISDI